MNPTTGETNSEMRPPAPCPVHAFAEECPESIALAMPTPRIDPMSVWELEAGSPKYHVPRFQTIAEISRAKTMANPDPDPTLRTNSTGNKATME